MKKLILSALALVALVSCSKSDESSLSTTDAEVRISSSIATRTVGNTWGYWRRYWCLHDYQWWLY
ncbi:MAG: hypothetical protein SNH13_06320 [Rikenellaceae bacterium]